MRRLYQIGLIIALVLLALLVLYAHPTTRPWMEAKLGPPLTYAFGSAYAVIINSPPALFLIANPIWLFIIGVILGVFPISFPLIHRSFNWGRAKFVRSSVNESALYPRQQAPTYTVTQAAQQPEKITTQPVTPVAPTPEPEPEPEPVKQEAEPSE